MLLEEHILDFTPLIHRRPADLLAILMLSPPIILELTGSGTLELGLCVLRSTDTGSTLCEAGMCVCLGAWRYVFFIPMEQLER